MTEVTKGRSPFYPGQPVPVELFVGRAREIDYIMTRGVGQVAAGKPMSVFIQGEYGIGKSSIARYVQTIAEKSHNLHGIYASLGGCKSLSDLASAVLAATLNSGALEPKRSESVRNWLAKYIGTQDLLGFTVNLAALKQDAPQLSTAFGMLEFLNETSKRLASTGVKGIVLILDEINGITSDPQFAHFIKGIIEANAMSNPPLPLLLILCGVEERRRDMIRRHEPIDRVFEVVDIGTMTDAEMAAFFTKAFESVNLSLMPNALESLKYYSAGFPKIMHPIGDWTYWETNNQTISPDDVGGAVLQAAEDIGKKYVDPKVSRALRSKDYQIILSKIAKLGIGSLVFSKKDIYTRLSAAEQKKFNNFIHRMKELQVIRSGDCRGEYIFNVRMVQVYLWLQEFRKEFRSK